MKISFSFKNFLLCFLSILVGVIVPSILVPEYSLYISFAVGAAAGLALPIFSVEEKK